MTQVKGSALTSTLRFARERFGENGLREVLARLDPEDRARVEAGVLVSSWYPFRLMLSVMRETHAVYGASLPHLYREMGRASADYSLTTIYKIFVRIGSPQFTLGKAARVFQSYYDTGTMEAIVNERGHTVLELRDFGEPAPEFCERLMGWLERTLELTGGRDLKGAHPRCRHRGDPTCQFEGYWS